MYPTITIFTPTYNRIYILDKCYYSLKNQTFKEFTWLIIDDGSTDNTEKVVSEWIKEGDLKIVYYKKENGGKNSAHNLGVKIAETELFTCVDSDDYITSTAIEDILKTWEMKKNDDIGGIVALKGENEKEPLYTYIPNNLQKTTLFDLYNKYGFKGDTMLIYRTEILKKHLFPEIEGEKFIPEAYLYDKIDQNYKLLPINKVIYICNYLEDGYTKNYKKIIVQNPKGYALFYLERMKISKTIYLKFRSATLYIVGKLLSKNFSFMKETPFKLLTAIAVPGAMFVYIVKYRCGKMISKQP